MDLRTFRRNGPGLAECESQAACVDCGRTVGHIGPGTRADRSPTWPHLGHNLDTGGKPIQRCARRAREKSLATELGFEGHMEWAEAMT